MLGGNLSVVRLARDQRGCDLDKLFIEWFVV